MQYAIDEDRFHEALKAAGYRSLSAFADDLGVHRNSLYHYLSGRTSIFPSVLSQSFEALGLDPREVIVPTAPSDYGLELIAPVVDGVLKRVEGACLVLFGSRAKGSHRRFSDFDLGLYAPSPISSEEYLPLLTLTDDLAEDLPVKVQLVNLSQAENDFLMGIVPDAQFLGGSLSAWLHLMKRKHE